MKKIIIVFSLFLFTHSAFATCTVEEARCEAGSEVCSGSTCSTSYYYVQPLCTCTDYCLCESFPPGYSSANCFCMPDPEGQLPACS